MRTLKLRKVKNLFKVMQLVHGRVCLLPKCVQMPVELETNQPHYAVDLLKMSLILNSVAQSCPTL